MAASGWSVWPVAAAAGRWRWCLPFAVPYKRYAAGVIGGFLQDVLHEGQTLSGLERSAGITRQTGACWLKQFGLAANAHRLEHLPQLASGPEPSAAVPAAVPAAAPGLGVPPFRAQMARV